ncbi:MAG: DUF3795 domain-containing protein [Candidatus Bathyarchaeia archaeon]
MTSLIGKCGFDCGTCPWGPYAREKMTEEEFGQFRKRAKKILGYKPMQKPCPICQTPDEEIPKGSKLPPRSCLVRQCVTQMGIDNCAYCSRFPCGQAKDTSGAWNREKFEEKHGAPIPEEDYHTFIEPFEGLQRLEAIRASLSPEEIVEAATVPPLEAKIIDFPEDLPFSKGETSAFKALHRVLATIKRAPLGLKDTDTYPQQTRLKNRRRVFFRFLWIFGLHGELNEENGSHLDVDSKTYIVSRKADSLAIWDYVDTVFKVLREFGVHCEHVPLTKEKHGKKGWLTPGGYMRNKGWFMKMSFDDGSGGASALEALKRYATKLNEKYGKRAFRYFSNVDMRVLRKD